MNNINTITYDQEKTNTNSTQKRLLAYAANIKKSQTGKTSGGAK